MARKYYCSKCGNWKAANQFTYRQDRDCPYAWCKKCCDSNPLMSSIFVYPSWQKVMEKESRTEDYPEVEERGYGRIYG